MKPIVFHPSASLEFDTAVAFYEEIQPGLGIDLLDEVKRITSHVSEFPLVGAPYSIPDYRFLVTRRFPYIIYYMDMPNQIWIVAVAHGNRKPGYWKARRP